MAVRIDEVLKKFDSDREQELGALEAKIQAFFGSRFPMHLHGSNDPEVGDILPVFSADGDQIQRSDRGDRMLRCGWKQVIDKVIHSRVCISSRCAYANRRFGGPILFVPGDGPLAAVRIRRKVTKNPRNHLGVNVSYVGVALGSDDESYKAWIQAKVIEPFEQVCADYDAIVASYRGSCHPSGHREMENAKRDHANFVALLRGK
jgi:hypothetical protein